MHSNDQQFGVKPNPASTPYTSALQHVTEPQANDYADYHLQMIPANMRSDHGLSSSHLAQQQQPHPHHHQQPQTQARRMHQSYSTTTPPVPSKQHKAAASSAVTSLLPYCTAEVPLSNSQVIAITDVAGSLKELMLLALRAKAGDEGCASRLESALGSDQVTTGIVDFFSDEYEVL